MIDGTRLTGTPIRWGMIGGGQGSQIGYIHCTAALRDNSFELLAGAFDINPERGRAFGEALGLDPARCYPDYRTLFEMEAARPDGVQAVSIATPNGTHFEICKAALKAGIHVVCEKPLCFTVAEAEELLALAQSANKVVGVTYGYAGHQLIEQARQMIANGELGEIRIVNMQFAHGFHNEAVEAANPATKWRVDPKFAGPSYVLGDIGTHPLYLSEVMLPDLKIKRLMCARQSFVKSRAPLEDNAYTLMEYDSGAVGSVWSCAVNSGSMHAQKIRVIVTQNGGAIESSWNGGTSAPINYRSKCKANRRKYSNAAWAICTRMRCTTTASAVVTRRGSSRPGPTFTTATRRRWWRKTAAQRAPSATRTSTPASRVCAGLKTASARRIRAVCGSIIGRSGEEHC